MSQIYIEYTFTISPLQPASEIVIAELGYTGFESFIETETGVLAYIQKGEWNAEILKDIHILASEEFEIAFQYKEIDQVNWNEEWEKNFEPILVHDTCVVRATFHKPFNVPYEIVIDPKMSFGTGHHETTFMMLRYILDLEFKGQTVLDMGCGTAVLAILAAMKGAASIDAIDIDDWCVENSIENIARNNGTIINVFQGDAREIPKQKYNTVIANINRNILLADMQVYKESMLENATLLLSGFYTEDLPVIKDCCNNLGLRFVDNKEKNNWVSARFILE